MLKVITVTNDMQRTQPLIYSLEKFGWDYHIIECEWRGFGTKLIETYNYLKEHTEETEFVFCDAFDVVALGTPQEFLIKKQAHYSNDVAIYSAERGLWPPTLEPKRDLYPTNAHGFNYLNSGLYYCTSDIFARFIYVMSPKLEDDDQFLCNNFYLHSVVPKATLDCDQVLFNSHSFIQDGEYSYNNNRVQILGNEPVFIHCNGKTDMTKIYELI